MEQKREITSDKRILLDTIKVLFDLCINYGNSKIIFKDYSEVTTIHGINYVFASFLSLQERYKC